jgi:membrane protein
LERCYCRTYREIQDDRVLALAAGVAFYSLVSLFPAIAAGVSSYALFANVATISKHLSIASDIVPAGSLDRLGERSPALPPRATASSPSAFSWGSALRCGARMRA